MTDNEPDYTPEQAREAIAIVRELAERMRHDGLPDEPLLDQGDILADRIRSLIHDGLVMRKVREILPLPANPHPSLRDTLDWFKHYRDQTVTTIATPSSSPSNPFQWKLSYKGNTLMYFSSKDDADTANNKFFLGEGHVHKASTYFCSAYIPDGGPGGSGYRRCMEPDAMPLDFNYANPINGADKTRAWVCRNHHPWFSDEVSR